MSNPQAPATGSTRLRILWSFARPYLPQLLLALFLSLFVSSMSLATPLVTQWVLNAVGTDTPLTTPVLVLVGLLIVSGTVSFIQWILLGTLAENVVYDARRDLLRRYLGARVFSLLQRGAGQLVTRVTSDTLLLNQAASSSVVGIINGFIMTAGSLILMGTLDIPLLLLTLGVTAIIGILLGILMPKIALIEEKAQASLGDLGSELEGSLRAIKTVKSSSAEQRRFTALMHHTGESRRWSLTSVRIQAAAWTIADVGINAAVIAVLSVGAYRISIGEMTVPVLVAFLLYVWGLAGPVEELTSNLSTFQSGMAAAGRIHDIRSLPQEDATTQLHDSKDAPTTSAPKTSVAPVPTAFANSSPGAPVLEFKEVTASYTENQQGAHALTGLSLRFPARGHVAIVGPSGAGKTTVLSLAMRFLEPQAGTVTLDGVPSTQLSHDQWRAAFAYVEQETPVIPGSIRDNLLFTNPLATEEDMHRVLTQLNLSEKIAGLPDGLDTHLTDTNFSGGQRQRIAVARALLAQRPILLLDEATAQVDGISEAAIQQAVKEHARTGTVITIAHRLSTVIEADQIVVMQDGTVQATGTHRELLATSELYRELVAASRIEQGTGTL